MVPILFLLVILSRLCTPAPHRCADVTRAYGPPVPLSHSNLRNGLRTARFRACYGRGRTHEDSSVRPEHKLEAQSSLRDTSRDQDVHSNPESSKETRTWLQKLISGGPGLPTRRDTRSYVSNVRIFTDPNIKVSRSKLVTFVDETGDARYFSLGSQLLMVSIAYILFPVLQRLIAPSLEGINVEEVSSSITGEFAPVLDVLYALLASNTIQTLQNRQDRIQDAINKELCQLRVLAWEVILLARDLTGLRGLEARKWLASLWKYTDLLVFSSRGDELERMLEYDILFGLYQYLYTIKDMESLKGDSLNENVAERIRATADEAGRNAEKLLELRTIRLDTEGSGAPPAVFAILDFLSIYILISYAVLSASREIEPLPLPRMSIESWLLSLARVMDSTAQAKVDQSSLIAVSQEGVNMAATVPVPETPGWEPVVKSIVGELWPRVNAEAALFAILASMLVVVRSLLKDLDRPFSGHSHIRRTVPTSNILAIRADIESVFDREGDDSSRDTLGDLLQEVRQNSEKEAQERIRRMTKPQKKYIKPPRRQRIPVKRKKKIVNRSLTETSIGTSARSGGAEESSGSEHEHEFE
ncbi:hypothetical protein AAMO2058_001227600 [Amorphochlora amoebiformis]